MPSSFHLCFVESGYPHPHGGGGAGSYVQTVARELVRRGHTVSVVTAHCPQCPLYVRDEGVTVYRPKVGGSLHWYISKAPGLRIGALALRYLEHGWRLYKFLESLRTKEPIDVVEFTEGGDFWHALRPTFPYLVHLHGSRYTCLRMSGRAVGRADWYHRRLELFFIRRARWVVSPSQALLNIATDELEHPLKRTTVIPYPLDPSLIKDHQPKVGKTDSAKTVLFAARNDPVKGAEVLLRAVPLVCCEIPDVEFQFFGYEPGAETPIPERVRCYGFLPKAELLKRYQQADLYVVPSLWDSSPNTVYEAMAAGLPVVASRVGGIPELVGEGVTGLLVPPGEPEPLAQAIVTLLLDDERRIRMGQRGRERICQLASLKENVDQRLEIYKRVIEEFAAS